MPDVGHNGPPVASDQLKSIIERLETLNAEKAEIAEYIKEVLGEAKGNGFDTKAIRKIVALRKQDRAKLAEDKAVLELYAAAIGCLDLV